MPFDEEKDKQSIQSQKIGLKKISQSSIFDNMPKKPTPQEFEAKVKETQDKYSGYKAQVSNLTTAFNKAMSDKTLPQNKNIFQKDFEKELLTKMIQLAMDINNDPVEQEGMGSLAIISLLMKTCLSQRDKINYLEYSILQIEKKTSETIIQDLVKKEIAKALDIQKKSE